MSTTKFSTPFFPPPFPETLYRTVSEQQELYSTPATTPPLATLPTRNFPRRIWPECVPYLAERQLERRCLPPRQSWAQLWPGSRSCSSPPPTGWAPAWILSPWWSETLWKALVWNNLSRELDDYRFECCASGSDRIWIFLPDTEILQLVSHPDYTLKRHTYFLKSPYGNSCK